MTEGKNESTVISRFSFWWGRKKKTTVCKQFLICGDMHRAKGRQKFSVTWERETRRKELIKPSQHVKHNCLFLFCSGWTAVTIGGRFFFFTWQHQPFLSTAFSPGKESCVSRRVLWPAGPPGGSCAVASWETNWRKTKRADEPAFWFWFQEAFNKYWWESPTSWICFVSRTTDRKIHWTCLGSKVSQSSHVMGFIFYDLRQDVYTVFSGV